LISEYAGQFIATSKWNFSKSEKINVIAKAGLEQEILKQHSFLGVNKEEASEYIQFITDFFLLSYVVGEKTGNPFSEKYKKALFGIFDYINNFLTVSGSHPRYGDDDDGRVFILDDNQFTNNFINLLNAGAIIFSEPNFKKSRILDQKNIILFGQVGINKFENLPYFENVSPSSKFYENEGHYIFKRIVKGKELCIHFDAAPLGYLSIAAHGHADALSFVLHYNGHEILCDPGTYCYHTDPEWRKYFTSTSAHNTITINNKNQATYIGPTLWLHHYNCKRISSGLSNNNEFVFAEHDGYFKEEGVLHQRRLTLNAFDEIIIEDYVINHSNDETSLKIYFHFHPNIQLEIQNNYNLKIVSIDNAILNMSLDIRFKWNLYKGSIDPIQGWYSPSFYVKMPAYVLVGEIETQENIALITKISIT
jgi:hypothetical protein